VRLCVKILRLGTGRRLLSLALFVSFGVANGDYDIQDFEAAGEVVASVTFEGVQGLHEFDFVVRVVSLARRWINLAPPLDFSSFRGDRNFALSAVLLTAQFVDRIG
jgi:hypothetical protein